ncbi:hypothetical protein [Armatimonas sp.]|uniref:hypothetical protein n=1 Tax=Armatimonas sp. TaxID=1872638 RepID=UPI0037534FF9
MKPTVRHWRQTAPDGTLIDVRALANHGRCLVVLQPEGMEKAMFRGKLKQPLQGAGHLAATTGQGAVGVASSVTPVASTTTPVGNSVPSVGKATAPVGKQDSLVGKQDPLGVKSARPLTKPTLHVPKPTAPAGSIDVLARVERDLGIKPGKVNIVAPVAKPDGTSTLGKWCGALKPDGTMMVHFIAFAGLALVAREISKIIVPENKPDPGRGSPPQER